MGLSFTTAAGPRQRNHSRVQVPWDSWPYFTVSDSRLPFSPPLTIRRATVEVFEPASTRGNLTSESELLYDWRFTASQFLSAPNPLRLTVSNFFYLNPSGHSAYVTSSLTRGRVCRLQLLLTLVSSANLGPLLPQQDQHFRSCPRYITSRRTA
jgi:hypothetical protein